MKILKGKKEVLDKKAAKLISDKIFLLLKSQDHVVLAIPGGRSVGGIFENLLEKDIIWSKVHIFMVDERMVDINDPDSNFKLANETFISQIVGDGKMPESNVHPFYYQKPKEYEKELKKLGGKFDIVILGSGEDGHIAGLFPGLTINNKEDYFITFDNSPKPPPERMTSTRKLIERSGMAFLLFFGDGKSNAFKDFKNNKITIEQCPAKIVYNIPESYVLTDLNRRIVVGVSESMDPNIFS